MTQGYGFLQHPGVPGPFGALMDEYARAAEDLCRVVEALTPTRWNEERASSDPDTASLRAVCTHAALAARGYAGYIRKARGLEPSDAREGFVAPTTPAELRAALRAALHWTEGALDGLYDADEKTVTGLAFTVRWGPTYDPEMILEHGIVHLLRHRRQIERW